MDSDREIDGYRRMLSSIDNQNYEDEEFFQFTYSSDIDIIAFHIFSAYIKKYGYNFKKPNSISLINEDGGGNFMTMKIPVMTYPDLNSLILILYISVYIIS